jgi:protein PhnA
MPLAGLGATGSQRNLSSGRSWVGVRTERGRWLVIAILSTVTASLPPCPECSSEYTYELGALLVCPECAHEWEPSPAGDATESAIKDAVGNVLADGDTVIVTKNLKVKGNPTHIKSGTKVRNIRLVDSVDGHDIDCKVDGFGSMQLKSSVVKKV